MDQSIKRIGFACKINSEHDKADPKLNLKGTTISWLNRQKPEVAVNKLYDLTRTNLTALEAQICWVSTKGPERRMFRITSDVLPAYTHDDWSWVYQQNEFQIMIADKLAQIGDLARKCDVRLSFHPGQFCVLASDNPGVVENSIYEFEYHCDLIRMMGYGREFQDFKCNVHIGGKLGPQGIKDVLPKLSRVARNCLTIENAEFTWGLEHSLELKDDVALVLDIHHHWIKTGEYIEPDDWRVKQVQESWRGVRPVIHYSVSREEHLGDHCPDTRPDLAELLSMGFTKAKLRAHSDYFWNRAVNKWALTFRDNCDIMLESKQKNLAQLKLFKEI